MDSFYRYTVYLIKTCTSAKFWILSAFLFYMWLLLLAVTRVVFSTASINTFVYHAVVQKSISSLRDSAALFGIFVLWKGHDSLLTHCICAGENLPVVALTAETKWVILFISCTAVLHTHNYQQLAIIHCHIYICKQGQTSTNQVIHI